MTRTVFIQILLLLLSISSQAQKADIFSMMSPKLEQFITSHPGASSTLSNVVSEAFPKRTVFLYYYYARSGDESVSRAFHYYPSDSTVGIVIRENQQPIDEYICLVFEMLNSEGEKRFQELEEKAKSGTVSKEDFVMSILRQEFKAEMKARKLLGRIKTNADERTGSYFYDKLMDEPTHFKEALAYKEKESPKRGLIKYYEQEYDSLRNSGRRSNTS